MNYLHIISVSLTVVFSSYASAVAVAPLGTWWCSSAVTGCGPATVTLFPNGEFFQATFGIPSPGDDGGPGIERGTYTFTPDSITTDRGTLVFTTLFDTNGGWGANSGTFPIRITSEQVQVLNNNMPTFYRLGTAAPIENGWIRTTPSGISILSFLSNGKFLYGIQSGQSTIEYGDYTYDSLTGLLKIANVQKSGPDQSLSGLTNLHLTLSNQQLTVTSDQIQLNFASTPLASVPEMPIYAMLVLGMALIRMRFVRPNVTFGVHQDARAEILTY